MWGFTTSGRVQTSHHHHKPEIRSGQPRQWQWVCPNRNPPNVPTCCRTGHSNFMAQPKPPYCPRTTTHDIDATPLGPRINKVSAPKHDGINLLLQLFPPLPYTITRVVSTGYSSKKNCSPRPSQQPMTTPPPTVNHQPSSIRSTHTSLRCWQSLMLPSRTSVVDNHHTRAATTWRQHQSSKQQSRDNKHRSQQTISQTNRQGKDGQGAS